MRVIFLERFRLTEISTVHQRSKRSKVASEEAYVHPPARDRGNKTMSKILMYRGNNNLSRVLGILYSKYVVIRNAKPP